MGYELKWFGFCVSCHERKNNFAAGFCAVGDWSVFQLSFLQEKSYLNSFQADTIFHFSLNLHFPD